MAEKERADVGVTSAPIETPPGGHPVVNYTIDAEWEAEMQRKLKSLLAEARVEMPQNGRPAEEIPLEPPSEDGSGGEAVAKEPDVITAATVQEIIERLADRQGHARDAVLDALRPLIGYLPREERRRLSFYSLFSSSRRQEEIELYLASCPPPPEERTSVFTPKSLSDLLAMPPKQWLVSKIIGAGDMVMLYGPPGSGKSFVVIDLIFAACLGRQWAKRFAVERPLHVAYCAGEGLSGLPQRFAAAAQHYGVQELPTFTFFDIAPQLFSASRIADGGVTDGIERFVGEWRERQTAGRAGALDLLVIDTLHSATTGADENSAQDMGRVLQAAKMAGKALGCAVLLVHHTNKAGTGERGSSALRGAMDCMVEVKSSAGGFVLSCEKLKDDAAWKPQKFSLVAMGESAYVWWDEPGDLPNNKGEQSAGLLAVMKQHPGRSLTARQLAEATGIMQSTAIVLLSRLVEKGMVKRSLLYEDKPNSSRNPWVYEASE